MSAPADTVPLTRREVEARIVARAWQDEGFRAEFLADPVAAFVRHTGIPAARLPRIVVHEETPGTWHIVLPAKPAAAGELSEAELEGIAGGTDMVVTVLVATLGGATPAGTTATMHLATGGEWG